METEGFAAIHRLRDVAAIERLDVRRAPTPSSSGRRRGPQASESG
jgi:hypothetical protein